MRYRKINAMGSPFFRGEAVTKGRERPRLVVVNMDRKCTITIKQRKLTAVAYVATCLERSGVRSVRGKSCLDTVHISVCEATMLDRLIARLLRRRPRNDDDMLEVEVTVPEGADIILSACEKALIFVENVTGAVSLHLKGPQHAEIGTAGSLFIESQSDDTSGCTVRVGSVLNDLKVQLVDEGRIDIGHVGGYSTIDLEGKEISNAHVTIKELGKGGVYGTARTWSHTGSGVTASAMPAGSFF